MLDGTTLLCCSTANKAGFVSNSEDQTAVAAAHAVGDQAEHAHTIAFTGLLFYCRCVVADPVVLLESILTLNPMLTVYLQHTLQVCCLMWKKADYCLVASHCNEYMQQSANILQPVCIL